MTRLLLGLLTLTLLHTGPAAAQDKVRIVVGGKSAVFYLPLSVTERLGYFKDAGLDVEISDVQSGGRALQSIVGGSADIGIGTFDHTIQMQAKNQPVVALLQYGRYPGFVLAMMAGKADRYKAPKDLKGMKIGVTSPGSSTHFMAAYMMVRAGLKAGRRLVHRHRRHLDRGRGGAPRRDRRHRQLRSDDDADGDREAGEDRGRHAHRRRHAGGLWRAVSGRRDLRHAGLSSRRIRKAVQAVVNAFVRGLKWIAGHSAEDIAKLMPQEYALGNLPIYVKALSASKPMYSPDGHFEPGAVETAYAVLKVFDPAVAAATIDLTKTYNDSFVTQGDVAEDVAIGHGCRDQGQGRHAAARDCSSAGSPRRGWTPRAHQLELSGARPRRPLGAADRADRRRQDAGGLSADAGGVERARGSAWDEASATGSVTLSPCGRGWRAERRRAG